uniref:Uncharacterized protein n=1 Tax=Acrobeloides nanus TaxID=290746 RepID=A0A914C0C1_9BILA
MCSTRTQRNNDNVQFGNGNIRFGNVVQNEDIEATSRQMQGVYNSGNGRVPMNQCNQFMDHPATRAGSNKDKYPDKYPDIYPDKKNP